MTDSNEPGYGYGQQPPYGQEPGYGQYPPPPGYGPGFGGGYGAGYGAGYGGPPGPPPPNYLVWSILSTLFCCLPAGVASIVFAAQVNSKWQAGDFEGAMSASRNARTWAIVATCVGALVLVVWVVVLVAGGVSVSHPVNVIAPVPSGS